MKKPKTAKLPRWMDVVILLVSGLTLCSLYWFAGAKEFAVSAGAKLLIVVLVVSAVAQCRNGSPWKRK